MLNKTLRVAAETGAVVRMILMLDGQMRQVNAIVTAFDGQEASLEIKRPRKSLVMPVCDILGAELKE